MAASKILLAEKDLEYGMALARAVSAFHNEFELSVESLETLSRSMTERRTDFNEYDLILLDGCTEETAETIADQIKDGGRIAVLTEYHVENLRIQSENENRHFWRLCKYTNAYEIISDLNYLIGSSTGKKNLIRKMQDPVMIGFYSICGGSGKSVIALSASRELSRYHDKKTLYLCFEEIPATELFVSKSTNNRNIGDYLYYLFERKNENLCCHPEAFTSSDEFGVESFYPSGGRNDLNFLTQEEIVSFLKTVSESSRYDYIIMDLKGDLSEETMFLMNLCSKIVLILSEDPVSEFKSRKCIDYIVQLGNFQTPDQFVPVVNRACGPEPEREETGLPYLKNHRKIYIEEDKNSFRFVSNHMAVDISHSFGIGIKKIADEILLTESTVKKNGGLPAEETSAEFIMGKQG